MAVAIMELKDPAVVVVAEVGLLGELLLGGAALEAVAPEDAAELELAAAVAGDEEGPSDWPELDEADWDAELAGLLLTAKS